MKEKYIKKNGKVYLQRIEEIEINLDELRQRIQFIEEETNRQKEKIQKQIDQIEDLLKK